jgi:hypothetical protein
MGGIGLWSHSEKTLMPQVIVNIDAAGEVKVEANGVTGSGCQALTRAIEESLGSTSADQKKPEYFQQQKAGQSASAGAK